MIKLLNILKLFRRNSYINIFTSIVLNYRTLELSILTDGGRCCRPLYIMENKELLINIDIPIPQNNFVLIDIIAYTYEIEKGTKIGSSAFHTTQHSKLDDILINVLYKDKPYKIQIYSYYNSNFCFRSKVSYTYNLDD